MVAVEERHRKVSGKIRGDMAETSLSLLRISTQLDESGGQSHTSLTGKAREGGGGSSLWRPFCIISLSFLKTHLVFDIYY